MRDVILWGNRKIKRGLSLIIEFEKRVNALTKEIDEAKARGDKANVNYFLGALHECERLYSFYKNQMLARGRIVPDGKEDPNGENP